MSQKAENEKEIHVSLSSILEHNIMTLKTNWLPIYHRQ